MSAESAIPRRGFLARCALGGLGAAFCAWPLRAHAAPPPPSRASRPSSTGTVNPMKESMFQESLGNGRARCTTCPNQCNLGDGDTGRCHSRMNRQGRIYTMTYGRPCLVREDPLAKNPLYHVDPGANAIGVATAGCNLMCAYCQNWDISQVGPDKTKNMDLAPQDLPAKARERNLRWITFSYTEPVVYLEYLMDAAKAARPAGVRVAVCTAGFVSPAPLAELLKHVDAVSVTLKGYSPTFYRDTIGCNRDDVLKSVTAVVAAKKWVEIVTLLVPGMNDGDDEIRSIARFVAGLDRNIPLHFLRFAPAYKLRTLQPMPVKTLERARAIAQEQGLSFVYLDLSGHEGANTYCPGCKKPVIERAGFTVLANRLRNGACPSCNRRIPGFWA